MGQEQDMMGYDQTPPFCWIDKKTKKKYVKERRSDALYMVKGIEWFPFLQRGFLSALEDDIEILDTPCGVITKESIAAQ